MVNRSDQLVETFVNTRHIELGDVVEERLGTPEQLTEWLVSQGLLEEGGRATRTEVKHAEELREAIRDLLLAHNDVDTDTRTASEVLDRAAERGRVQLRFDNCCAELVAVAPGVAGALGRVAIAVQQSMADGAWERLKACRALDCRWAFVDETKNGSRAWCSMSSCGNREKARAYRLRHAH